MSRTRLTTGLLVACLYALPVLAAEPAGTIKVARGGVVIERAKQRLPVAVGDKVEVGDRITTAEDGTVGVTLRDNTMLSAGPKSTLDLNNFRFDSTTHQGAVDASVKRGTLAMISGKIAKASPADVQVRTATTTLGVRGTEFIVDSGSYSPLTQAVIAIANYRDNPDAEPPQGPERFILLPEPDGKVGKLALTNDSGRETTLATAYAAAEISGAGDIALGRESAASVKARYGSTLDARPPRPRSFLLYFKPGSEHELAAGSHGEMKKLRAYLAQHAAPEVTLIGHTDRAGTLEENDALSLRRAEALGKRLKAEGLRIAGVELAGRGEREPLAKTADGVANARNRRVEVNVR